MLTYSEVVLQCTSHDEDLQFQILISKMIFPRMKGHNDIFLHTFTLFPSCRFYLRMYPTHSTPWPKFCTRSKARSSADRKSCKATVAKARFLWGFSQWILLLNNSHKTLIWRNSLGRSVWIPKSTFRDNYVISNTIKTMKSTFNFSLYFKPFFPQTQKRSVCWLAITWLYFIKLILKHALIQHK